MNFRQLQTMQEALPILIRHLGAYVEMAGQDVSLLKERLAARVKSGIVLFFSAFFSLLTICLFVLAATWDTPYRLLASGIMAGVFIVTATASAIAMARSKPIAAFETVRREWGQDKLILERLLGDKDKHQHDDSAAARAAPIPTPDATMAEAVASREGAAQNQRRH